MSMGICDACLEPVFHTRMEDGNRLLLDPGSVSIRYMLREAETPKITRVAGKREPNPGAMEISIVRDVYAYKAIVYELHECPEKADGTDPRVGEELSV